MMIRLVVQTLCLILSAPFVRAADPPTCDGISATRRIVGYYDTYFAGTPCGTYPEFLKLAGYTHVNAAHAWIDPSNYTLDIASVYNPEIWRRLVTAKETTPGLQVWLSVGGWMMSYQNEATLETFSEIVSGEGKDERQRAFIDSLITTLQEYGFDGVDLDWLPGRTNHDGYTDFLSLLRRDLEETGYGYGLSVTTPRYSKRFDGFDLGRIQHVVDWFNVMTYDINDAKLTRKSISAHSNMTEFDDALSQLWVNDVDPAKVTLGLAYYGRSYTLEDESCNDPGCATSGFGASGVCYDTPGYKTLDQINDDIERNATLVYHDEVAAINVATYDSDQWIAYDDEKTFAQKVKYANEHCIGGMNVWSIDLDTSGDAIEALSKSTGQLERATASPPDASDSTSECFWSGCIDPAGTCSGRGLGGAPGQSGTCQENCPSGTSASFQSSNEGLCEKGQYQLFCCPNSGRPDRCHVREDHEKFDDTRCNGRCSGSEVKIGTDTNECLTGWNDVCCTRAEALHSQQQCSWTTSCSQSPECPNNRPNLLGTSPFGDGPLEEPCAGEESRALCCDEPNPYGDCKWEGEASDMGWGQCSGECPAGKTLVASSTEGCSSGSKILCCGRGTSNATMAWYGSVLDTFFQEPICPSTSTEDDFKDSDIDPDAVSTLIPRDFIPDKDATIGLSDIRFLVGALNGASWLSTQIRDVYDDHVARGKPDSGGMIDVIAYDDLQDPVSAAMDAWCTEADTLQMIETQHISDSRCVLEWNSTDTTKDLEKRRFQGNSVGRETVRSGNNARPNLGALLRRILDTEDLTFLYSRVLSYTNPQTPTREARDEVNLEVAYELGPNANDLREQEADRFVVFHFHIIGMDRHPVRAQDQNEARDITALFPKIEFAHVFHGQYVFNAYAAGSTPELEWRVDWGRRGNTVNGRPNERSAIVRCPEGRAWFAGGPVPSQRDLIEEFGDHLFQQGILTSRTLRNWDEDGQRWLWDTERPVGGQGHDYSNIGASPDENGPAFRPADMRPSATNGYIAFDNALHSPPDAGQGSGASRGRGRGRGYRGPTPGRPGQNRGGGEAGRGGRGGTGNQGGRGGTRGGGRGGTRGGRG